MKKIHKYFYITALAIIFLSCRDKSSKIQSEILINYLKKHNLNLRNDYFYVLIPTGSCKSCSKQAFERINQISKNNQINNLIYITSNQSYANELKNKECIYDSLGKMDVLNLELGNLNIIHIKDNQIESNTEITNANLQLIDSLFSGKIQPSY